MSAFYQYTGRQLAREVIARQVFTRRINTFFIRRHDVCHTTTTIEVIDDKGGVRHDFKEQTIGRGHRALVTAAIEVTHLTGEQVPRRTDMHLRLVVTTKEAAHLIFTTAGEGEGGINAHLQEAVV